MVRDVYCSYSRVFRFIKSRHARALDRKCAHAWMRRKISHRYTSHIMDMTSLPFPNDDESPTFGASSSPTPETNLYSKPVAVTASESTGTSAVVGTNSVFPASLRSQTVSYPEGTYLLPHFA